MVFQDHRQCKVEYSSQRDATYRDYRPMPRGVNKTTGEVVMTDELVNVTSSRQDFMERLKSHYETWISHMWIHKWQNTQRHLDLATFGTDTIVIHTDFAAQHVHKSSDTATCSQHNHSNMAVFCVTHSPVDDPTTGEQLSPLSQPSSPFTFVCSSGVRTVTTDVWRAISKAKHNHLFHNVALDLIAEHYRQKLGARFIHLWTDGCRGQYKGRRNFYEISQFPHKHHGMQLIHCFAASHHFKVCAVCCGCGYTPVVVVALDTAVMVVV